MKKLVALKADVSRVIAVADVAQLNEEIEISCVVSKPMLPKDFLNFLNLRKQEKKAKACFSSDLLLKMKMKNEDCISFPCV